jgi:hypothetical protein
VRACPYQPAPATARTAGYPPWTCSYIRKIVVFMSSIKSVVVLLLGCGGSIGVVMAQLGLWWLRWLKQLDTRLRTQQYRVLNSLLNGRRGQEKWQYIIKTNLRVGGVPAWGRKNQKNLWDHTLL